MIAGEKRTRRLHEVAPPFYQTSACCCFAFFPKRGAVRFFNHATLADEKIGPSRGDGGRERQMALCLEKSNFNFGISLFYPPRGRFLISVEAFSTCIIQHFCEFGPYSSPWYVGISKSALPWGIGKGQSIDPHSAVPCPAKHNRRERRVPGRNFPPIRLCTRGGPRK